MVAALGVPLAAWTASQAFYWGWQDIYEPTPGFASRHDFLHLFLFDGPLAMVGTMVCLAWLMFLVRGGRTWFQIGLGVFTMTLLAAGVVYLVA